MQLINNTLTVSRDEWNDAISYLLKAYKRATRDYDTYIRESLDHVNNYVLQCNGHLKRLSLGVVATKLIAYRYGLNLKRHHKNQNYVIEVK